MPKNKFDIIIIGAGAGGLNIASFMNRIGFKVLLIDKNKNSIGGDCLNFGCVPSKALLSISKKRISAQKMKDFGVKTGKVDWIKIKKYIKEKQDVIRKHENVEYFRKLGMTIKLGKARFVSKNQVAIGNKIFIGKKIVLATGSQPREIRIPGIEKINVQTNETIFDLKKFPKKLLIIGAGPIGIEMAQAFSGLGSKVSVINDSNRFLSKEDPEIVQLVMNNLKKQGVRFFMEAELKKFQKNKLTITDSHKKNKTLEFDEVLVAVGRELNFTGLDLEKAKIKTNKETGKLKIDKYLRTTNKNVLAVGDVVGGPQFTHIAELHASVAISNFFSPLEKKVDYSGLAWTTFVYPELATFGENEKGLQEKGTFFHTLKNDFSKDDRAIVEDYPDSMAKIFVSPKGLILGGSILAPGAGELIQELILAKQEKIPLKKIFQKVYPYPTATRINRTIFGTFLGKKLDNENIKKIFKFLFH